MKLADVSMFIVDKEFPSEAQGYHEPHPLSVEAGELGGAINVSKSVIPPNWPSASASGKSSTGQVDRRSLALSFFDRGFAAVLDRGFVDFRGRPILRNGLYTHVVPWRMQRRHVGLSWLQPSLAS